MFFFVRTRNFYSSCEKFRVTSIVVNKYASSVISAYGTPKVERSEAESRHVAKRRAPKGNLASNWIYLSIRSQISPLRAAFSSPPVEMTKAQNLITIGIILAL
jgi:hypothetical protein